ncbi:MAG TPA: hypothetical protein VI485_12730 [Vicinamibacterales bacterium]|nr:hypothetical protein [Vicinamibacterales bacterium]
MNERRQRRVLYRECLFRIVDRELLSTHSTGDASQLLLQLLTLLLGLSVLFSAPALFIDAGPSPQAQLMLAWSVEHFLIATTMLTVGVFAVLGWGSMFPDQRDILVLAPLPVRAHTILVAKVAALGTSLAATVLALHVVTSLVWTLTLIAPDGGMGAWLRLFVAYWVTMMVCALVSARLTFAMPRDLPANWIFRILPVRGGARYVSARRSVFIILAAGPVWLLSACVFLAKWPWMPALGHLIILALLGSILVELCLSRSQGIPFTCAYLPGQSRSHVTAPLAVVLLLVLAVVGADVERRVLQAGGAYAAIVSLLALVWVGARWRTSWLADAAAPDFEDEAADGVVSLDLWDSRVPRRRYNQAP